MLLKFADKLKVLTKLIKIVNEHSKIYLFKVTTRQVVKLHQYEEYYS